MKSSRKLFLIMEFVLALLAAAMLILIFGPSDRRKRITVVVSNSDSSQWSAFISGVKQAARTEEVDVVIAGTGRISGASEERTLLQQAVAEGADALIVEPAPGRGTAAMLQDMAKEVPLILAGGKGDWERSPQTGNAARDTALPCVSVDNTACGEALAALLLEDYGGSLSGKTIGIVSHALNTEAAVSRHGGFMDGIEGSGAVILWQLLGLERTSDPQTTLSSAGKVDLIIALDSESLQTVGTASQARKIQGAVVYGIGTARQNLYDLDHDDIRGLIYPNGFDMGVQSLTELCQRLSSSRAQLTSHTIDYLTLRRRDLFLPENEDLLFMVE